MKPYDLWSTDQGAAQPFSTTSRSKGKAHREQARMTSMRDRLRTIHIITAVLVLQIVYRITMLLQRPNY